MSISAYHSDVNQFTAAAGAAAVAINNNFKALADRGGPSKLNATVAPGVPDDGVGTSNGGTIKYKVGSIWIDTTHQRTYVCLDNTTNAALWVESTTNLSQASVAGVKGSNVSVTWVWYFNWTVVLGAAVPDLTIAGQSPISTVQSSLNTITATYAAPHDIGDAWATSSVFGIYPPVADATGVTLNAEV